MLLVVAFACAPQISAGQTQETQTAAAVPPDPTTVTIPDLSFKPSKRDAGRYDEYFYFHKSGVSYEKAFTDLQECAAYSQVFQFMLSPPHFVPLGSEPYKADQSQHYDNAFLQFGLIGVGILGFAMDILASYDERVNTRRCMGYKHYQRYGTSRAIWRQIDKGNVASQKIARLALIASGPVPAGEPVEP
ncbi:MAG TPA: hypothetical protein VJL82_05380 [Rhizomicrobium sp.]|nr:hypothetical protein [Rhizomicrobium sp.]